MMSTPWQAFATRSSLRKSISRISISSCQGARFSRLPVEKLSRARTVSPLSTSACVNHEPINPAAPVTKKVAILLLRIGGLRWVSRRYCAQATIIATETSQFCEHRPTLRVTSVTLQILWLAPGDSEVPLRWRVSHRKNRTLVSCECYSDLPFQKQCFHSILIHWSLCNGHRADSLCGSCEATQYYKGIRALPISEQVFLLLHVTTGCSSGDLRFQPYGGSTPDPRDAAAPLASLGSRNGIFRVAGFLYLPVGVGANWQCEAPSADRLVRRRARGFDSRPGDLDGNRHASVRSHPFPLDRGPTSADCREPHVLRHPGSRYLVVHSLFLAGDLLAQKAGISSPPSTDRNLRTDRGGLRPLPDDSTPVVLCGCGYVDFSGRGARVDRESESPRGVSLCAAGIGHLPDF